MTVYRLTKCREEHVAPEIVRETRHLTQNKSTKIELVGIRGEDTRRKITKKYDYEPHGKKKKER